jgi:hypothetical protein
MVTAHTEDGASITLSRVMGAGVDITTYWSMRRDELSALFGEVKVIIPEGAEKELSNDTLGNAKSAASVEYTYEYNGKTYHVYQIFAVTSFNGYVFTYTAENTSFPQHLDLVKTIAGKVKF